MKPPAGAWKLLPKKNCTGALGATPVCTSPKTMIKATDSPVVKAWASRDRLNSGFVALEVRMRAARPLADVLTLMVSSGHCASVSSNIVWLKGFGSPKKESCRLLFF